MFSKNIYCTVFLLRTFLSVRSRYYCHWWRMTFVTFGMFEIIFGKPSTPFYEWPRKDVTILPQLLATNRVISTKHQHTLFAFDDALRRRREARSSSKFRNSRSIGPPRTTKWNEPRMFPVFRKTLELCSIFHPDVSPWISKITPHVSNFYVIYIKGKFKNTVTYWHYTKCHL